MTLTNKKKNAIEMVSLDKDAILACPLDYKSTGDRLYLALRDTRDTGHWVWVKKTPENVQRVSEILTNTVTLLSQFAVLAAQDRANQRRS